MHITLFSVMWQRALVYVGDCESFPTSPDRHSNHIWCLLILLREASIAPKNKMKVLYKSQQRSWTCYSTETFEKLTLPHMTIYVTQSFQLLWRRWINLFGCATCLLDSFPIFPVLRLFSTNNFEKPRLQGLDIWLAMRLSLRKIRKTN